MQNQLTEQEIKTAQIFADIFKQQGLKVSSPEELQPIVEDMMKKHILIAEKIKTASDDIQHEFATLVMNI